MPSRSGDRELSFRSVVHVNEKGGSFGGTEEYVTLLTEELDRRDVESHLVCGVVTGAMPASLRSARVVEPLASRQPVPGTGAAVAAAVAELDPDLVYVHNVFDPEVVTALTELPGRPAVVWYVHDHYVTCLTELRWRHDVASCPEVLGTGCLRAIAEGRCVPRLTQRVLDDAELSRRLALAETLEQVDAVVVVSEYMRALLAAANPAGAARLHRLIRPIRDPDRPAAPSRAALNPAIVLFAGRITAEKGLAVLISALAGLPAGGGIELRIAGVIEDAAYWTRCRELADAACRANPGLTVTPLGHLTYDAMDAELARAHVVAIPSQWPEPLGAIALEAMAAGAAVVASRIGGLAGSVVDGRTGLLVDAADTTAWTRALAGLLDDPERVSALGAAGREHARHASTDAHVAALDRIVAPLLIR